MSAPPPPRHRPSRPRRRSPLAALTAGDRPYALGLLALVVLIVVMALGPLQSLEAATARVETLADQRTELRQRVDALEERQRRLSDPHEVEVLAREELGLVKPGEIPFVVVTPEPEITKPAHPGTGDADGRTFWERLRDAVARLFR